LIIIGGGASIRAFPTLWDDIKGRQVMSVNYAYKFMKSVPSYQASIDRLFWKKNSSDMDYLASQGCKLINRNREYTRTKKIQEACKDKLFTGRRNLSGMFALSYAVEYLKSDKIYLFGYDFGVVNGKTHFYDNIQHSGINKDRAYLDKDKKVLPEVEDFNYFRNYDISIVGDSNIKSFKIISYSEFKEKINKEE
jgi:hypothetical protein